MDASQWPQGIGVEHHNKAMEPAGAGAGAGAAAPRLSPINNNSNNTNINLSTGGGERIIRGRPEKEQPLNCPRCNSTNTKFCYYNNYSLSQPRYFCKTCRRYWTEGGSLRNVPVGGGSRKNKRPSSSSPSTSSSSSKKLIVLPPDHHHHQQQQHQDLNLGYPHHHHVLPAADQDQNPSPPCSSSSPHFSSAVELFKGTAAAGGGGMSMSSFLHVAGPDMFAGGYPIQEFKPPALNFSLEAFDRAGGGVSGGAHDHDQNGTARLLFPVEDLKQLPSTSHPMEREHNHQIHHHHPQATGYWTGMLGGNSW